MSKDLYEVKKDYYYILEPLLHWGDKEGALKRLTIFQKRIEESILIKQAKMEVIKDMKKKIYSEIID